MMDLEKLMKQIEEDLKKGPIDLKEQFAIAEEMAPMYEHSSELLKVITNQERIDAYPKEGWAPMMLMALARATCIVLYGLKYTAKADIDTFEDYRNVLLPACNSIVTREIKKAEKLMEEEEKEKAN